MIRQGRSFVAALVLFAALVAFMPRAAPLFAWAFPETPHPVYARASFFELTLAHLELVAVSSFVAIGVGILTAVFVTRASGRAFLPMVGAMAAIGQTFPPVAVLALAVPVLGYGAAPTIAALILYAILPVLEATLTGLHAVPAAVRDAAEGLGFSPPQRLARMELPIAAPFILSGIRTAVTINIGTATIGSSVGAFSLGSPIIEGLSASNPAYVVQGSIVVAGLAIVVDRGFEWIASRIVTKA